MPPSWSVPKIHQKYEALIVVVGDQMFTILIRADSPAGMSLAG